MELSAYKTLSELGVLEDAWERLSKQEPIFVPSFSDLLERLGANGSRFLVLVAADNAQVISIACFVYGHGIKRYSIGERKLFDLPVKEIVLFGSCVLGQADEHVIDKLFKRAKEEWSFNLINVGEIAINSHLYKAVTTLHNGIAWRVGRKNSIRWLIKLPQSFDDYVKSLGSATRKNDVRKLRKFEREVPFEFHMIRLPEEVERFLRDGESISRKTYQWNVGQRLYNDATTRQQFMRLAKEGRLRAYIIYINKTPSAFAWGELNHRIYLSQNTGFDPEYRSSSPGAAIMMWVIRDLIENTDCEVFDFGIGGDDWGFKSRFGNTSINVAWVQLANFRPYSLLLFGLDKIINAGKNLLGLIVKQRKLRERLRRIIRRYGD